MSASSPRKQNVVRTLVAGMLTVSTSAALGYWIAGFAPSGTLISLFTYATLLLGVVWGFSMLVYNKLSDITDLAGIDYKQHRGLECAVRLRLQWFWFRAVMLAITALTANLPKFLKDGGIAPPAWTFGVAAGSIALALFLLRRIWTELEDIRELRSEVKELERREKLRTDQIQKLKAGSGDWKEDPKLNNLGRQDVDSNKDIPGN
jgi:hypothetical protein